jgi:hypothetical protein
MPHAVKPAGAPGLPQQRTSLCAAGRWFDRACAEPLAAAALPGTPFGPAKRCVLLRTRRGNYVLTSFTPGPANQRLGETFELLGDRQAALWLVWRRVPVPQDLKERLGAECPAELPPLPPQPALSAAAVAALYPGWKVKEATP